MRYLIILFLLLCELTPLFAQISLTLQEAISLAQQSSLQSSVNKINLEIAIQTYRLQKAQLLPQINLNANLPGYNSSITNVTQPDGTIKFTTVEQAYSSAGISLSQKIAATGGTFTASSNINRFDLLTGNKTTNYNTQPFLLGLTQPLFRFNEMRYSGKNAEYIRLIGSKSFAKQQEQLALDVSTLFFSALQTQTNIRLTQAIKSNTDTLLQTAKFKWQLGKIGEEEYLQIQLEQLNTNLQLQQLENNSQVIKNKLCNMLNLSITTELFLEEPTPVTYKQQTIDAQSISTLFKQYQRNNPEYEQQRLLTFQNQAALQRAKYNRIPTLNVIAGYGSNQSATALPDAYQNVLTQRNITLGVAVPIFSGGANQASLKIATYQQQNQQLQQQQLEQQIMNKLMEQLLSYNNSIVLIKNAHLSDTIAQRRYEISLNKYKAGKLTYTDFLLAQTQRNQSKQRYIDAIASYWNAYYQLRVNILYDIEKQEQLYKQN